MHIEDMQVRAVELRAKFAEFEQATYGREWSTEDLVMGLMTDVGDLAAAVQRVEERRPRGDAEPHDQLAHEISDCLWVLLVLAERFEVDVVSAFTSTMTEIEAWIAAHSA